MHRPLRALSLVLAIAAAQISAAHAGEISVSLKDSAGQPVANAVVLFRPSAKIAPATVARSYEVTQADVQFHPYVIVVPVGAQVRFPNHDKVRHHVYSFSAAKRFELKLYGKDETRSITFDQPGVVSLGCNIHDQMIGFVFVADTQFASKTGPDGAAVFEGVPAGPGTVVVWHPSLWTQYNEMSQSVVAPAQGVVRTAFVLKLHPPAAGKSPAL